jgi:hypothetical protein
MKQVIRITEADFKRIIKESVERILKEATAGGAGAVGVFSGGQPGNGSGLAGGATTTQNTPQGNGDNTIFGAGLTNKKKRNTDIINHGRDIYNAKGNSKSVPEENNDFFGDTTKRKNGKGGSISIPKHRIGESIENFEESPLWTGDMAHMGKVYYYLCKIYDNIMDNLQGIGIEAPVAYKALLPLQYEIKSHEEY